MEERKININIYGREEKVEIDVEEEETKIRDRRRGSEHKDKGR